MLSGDLCKRSTPRVELEQRAWDTRALQLKLDELLRATEGARSSLMNLEKLSDDELARLQKEFERISKSRTDRR